MTQNINDNTDSPIVEDEFTALKARADLMKLKYHPSISLDTLREKVNGVLNSKSEDIKKEEDKPEVKNEVKVPETENQIRLRYKNEAMKLIRITVVCMNPAKKEWQGEIFTVGNSALGIIKKFIPFNNAEGWHVPHMMYEVLKERMCQVFVTVPDGQGNKIRKGKLIKEFAIEVMPELTKKELDDLAHRQAATKSIE